MCIKKIIIYLYKMASVNVEYRPSDFLYPNIIKNNSDCANVDITKDCTYYSGDDAKCFELEVCKNKNYAEYLMSITHTHSGSEQRYEDVDKKYNTEIMNTVNLGIGIALCGLFIYYYNK